MFGALNSIKFSTTTKNILFYAILFLLPTLIYSQRATDTLVVNNENIHKQIWLLDNWHFVFEDDTTKQLHEIDFTASKIGKSSNIFDHFGKKNWKGNVWLYKKVKFDSSLKGAVFIFDVRQAGNLTLYFESNKPMIYGYNSRGEITYTNTAKLNAAGTQNIFIKFRNDDYEKFITAGLSPGFYLSLQSIEFHNNEIIADVNFNRSLQMFFTAFIFAFALLHLILFIYLRELKSNFYFFLLLVAYTLNIFFDHQAILSNHFAQTLFWLRIQRATLPFIMIFALRFLYSLHYTKIPKQFWLLIFLLISGGVLSVYSPINNFRYFNIALIAGIIEILRIITFYIKEKVNGAKIIGFGFIILFVFSGYDMLNDIGLVGPIGRMTNAYMFGIAGLTIAISISMAKEYGRINRKIVEDESNRIIMEADNERKTNELEEARKLQLSLLPQCADEMMGYQVCFDMNTATEVGGDYYDYMITDKDTLTIVIGDATGHGMKAGNMVVLIKSLFNTMGHTFYIPDFFNHCTRQIKKMNFGNLFMSMTMIKLKRDSLVISAAGMPPALIYRAASNQVEEILIKGMPLGAHDQFPYYQNKFNIEKNDVILLMTDGMVELFNSRKQLFGIDRIKKLLLDNHSLPPSKIVEKMFYSAGQWRNSHPQNDDITLVVLKKI